MLAGAHQDDGHGGSFSGSAEGPLPTKAPRYWKRYTCPPYSKVGASSPRCWVSRALQSRDPLDRRDRQREELVVDAHDQRLRDRERERQADREARAAPGMRLDEEPTAQLLDLGRDDVHADAAAGLLRQALGRAEPGLEDELQRLLVGDRLVGPQQPEAPRLGADCGDVEPGAIVLDDDDDLRALALQPYRDRAGLRLAARQALGRRLDAVHDRVAQHVLERRQHALEHLAIELAGAALDGELDLLAGLLRGLAHQAREALHVPLERHHPGPHQAVLQLGDDAALLQQQVLPLARQVAEQPLDARDVADRFRKRARELLDRRVAVELERVEVGASLRPRPGAGAGSSPRFRARACATARAAA